MKKFVTKMRTPFLKVKEKFLSSRAKFFETKAGKNTEIVIGRLAKFFGTKPGKFFLVLLSFASYMLFLTWQFSAIVIVMLYIHELGHIWAMKRQGMKDCEIYFIPFIGAAASSNSDSSSHKAGIVVAIMGPVWGFALAVMLGGVYFITKNPLYAVMASITAIFNLFNLLPIYPLDGGKIAGFVFSSIHWRLEIIFMVLSDICLIASGVLFLYHKYFLLAFCFIIFGIGMLIVSLFWEKQELPKLTFAGIFISIICYLVAIATMLVFALWIINLPETIEGVKIVREY